MYPLHGLKAKFEETWAKDRVFFGRYAGYISTQLGPKARMQDLNALAERIRKTVR